MDTDMGTDGHSPDEYTKEMVQDRVMRGISMRRRVASMTQKQLAEKLGVPQSYVSDWERGKWIPHLSQLWGIARALDCTLDELVGRPPDPKPPKPAR